MAAISCFRAAMSEVVSAIAPMGAARASAMLAGKSLCMVFCCDR